MVLFGLGLYGTVPPPELLRRKLALSAPPAAPPGGKTRTKIVRFFVSLFSHQATFRLNSFTPSLLEHADTAAHSHARARAAAHCGRVSEAVPSFGFIQLETNGCSRPRRCHFSEPVLFHVVSPPKFTSSVTTSRGHRSARRASVPFQCMSILF